MAHTVLLRIYQKTLQELIKAEVWTLHTEQTWKAGSKFERCWLSYSLTVNKCCFEPCCLFLAIPVLKQPMGSRFLWLVAFKEKWVGCVVNTTPRPFYPQGWPGTHCIGGLMDLGAGLDGHEKCRPHYGFFPPVPFFTFDPFCTFKSFRPSSCHLWSILVLIQQTQHKHPCPRRDSNPQSQ